MYRLKFSVPNLCKISLFSALKSIVQVVDIKTRAATTADLAVLKAFEQGIIQFERPFAPNLKEDPIEYYDLKSLIERTDAYVVVATVGDEIVGSGYGLIKDSKPYEKTEQHVYLGFMYVSPQFRGQGINGKIIDQLLKWTKERNLTELKLEVYAENEMAINAYEKRNFKPDLLKMRLNIEE